MIKKPNRKLFNTYANNLKLVIEAGRLPKSYEGLIYMCPLCKVDFSEDMVFPETGESMLTIEHIPPKSVGGKTIVLTCKACNNLHGAKIDSHLKKSMDFRDFLSKNLNEKIKAEFKINDNLMTRGAITIDEIGRVQIFMDEKKTDPKYLIPIYQVFAGAETGANSGKITVEPQLSYNKRYASLSLLRSAYLLLFQKFGYAFIFTKSAETIRRLIANFDVTHSFPFIFQSQFPDLSVGINIVIRPIEMQSYIVVFELKNRHRVGIIIPGAHDPELRVYDWIKENHKVTFEYIRPDDVDYLLDKSHCVKPITNWLKAN